MRRTLCVVSTENPSNMKALVPLARFLMFPRKNAKRYPPRPSHESMSHPVFGHQSGPRYEICILVFFKGVLKAKKVPKPHSRGHHSKEKMRSNKHVHLQFYKGGFEEVTCTPKIYHWDVFYIEGCIMIITHQMSSNVLFVFSKNYQNSCQNRTKLKRDHYLWPAFAMIFSRANLGYIEIWKYFLFFARMIAKSIKIHLLHLVKKITRPQITKELLFVADVVFQIRSHKTREKQGPTMDPLKLTNFQTLIWVKQIPTEHRSTKSPPPRQSSVRWPLRGAVALRCWRWKRRLHRRRGQSHSRATLCPGGLSAFSF